MTRGEPLEEPSFQLPKLLDIWAAGPFTSWPRSLRLNTRVEANLNGGPAACKRRSRILREKRSTAAAAERCLPQLTHGAHPVAQTEAGARARRVTADVPDRADRARAPVALAPGRRVPARHRGPPGQVRGQAQAPARRAPQAQAADDLGLDARLDRGLQPVLRLDLRGRLRPAPARPRDGPRDPA